MNRPNWRRTVAIAALLLIGTVGTVTAQQETGNVYGKALEASSGAGLPGVTVEISGVGAPRIQVTDDQGNFRFLGLDPGAYSMKASLEGFSTVEYPNVVVRLAKSSNYEFELSGAIEDVITVTTESPLLDERKLTSGAQLSQVELEKIPTSRDPWGVLNQAPGVLVDRINVGGNESGQQSNFRGQGVSGDDNAFLVDGVEITDMAAIGSSSTYYDFDQFTEMQMQTGGSDVTKVTSGVSVNLVTKRGTNDFRGSGRYIITDPDGYLGAFGGANADFDSGDLGPGQTSFTAPRINRIEDVGFEAGGPVKQDIAWLWGSWGQNDIKQFNAGGTADDTILENTALKLNLQLGSSNSAVASWNNGDKQKFGRGASTTRSPSSTWNQRGPSAIWKAEDTHVFNSSFFLSGQWSKVDGGFSLNAQGGTGSSAPETVWDANGVWQNSYLSGSSSRPSEEVAIDGSYFFNTGNTNHELKFGGRLRQFERTSPFGWAGRNIVNIAGTNFGNPDGPDDFFFLYRAGGAPNDVDYTSFWAQDTITFGNLTANVGFRADFQEGTNLAETVNENVTLPGVLPSIDFPGNDAGGFSWDTISPRLGLTYALGAERDTLLRASFSSFAESLGTGTITRTNPLGAAYAYYSFTDSNGDNTFQDGEDFVFSFASGFDPSNPAALDSPNVTDSNIDPEITNEIIFGVEHALLPEFVIGANLTWRNISNIRDLQDMIVDENGVTRAATAADYVLDQTITGDIPGGGTYSVPVFGLNPNVSRTGGQRLSNGDREREYLGASFTVTKRLANRWMARGFFNYGEAEWDVPASYLAKTDPNRNRDGYDVDGGTFITREGGSGKTNVILQSTWSWNITGMYQVAPDTPWGFNLSANASGREGYPIPYSALSVRTNSDGVRRNILVAGNVDDSRVDDLMTVDLSLSKEFRTAGNTSLTLMLDGFNLLDENFVLQRDLNLNGARGDFLVETLAPQVFRLGVRLNWR